MPIPVDVLLEEAKCYLCLGNISIAEALRLALLNRIASAATGGVCGGLIWGPDIEELVLFSWSSGSLDTSGSITSLSFPGLVSVDDELEFSGGDDVLLSFSAPLLQSAGELDGGSNDSLSSVNLDSFVQTTAGNFNLSQNPSLLTINLPVLASVFGNLEMSQGGFTSLSFPSLVSASGVDVSQNSQLASLSLPVFVTGGILCSDCQLITLSLPSWTTGSDLAANNNLLTSISAPLWVGGGVNTTVDVSNNQLTTINLPSLTDFFFLVMSDNPLVTVNAPNIVGSNAANGRIIALNCALNAATVNYLLHVAVLSNYGAGNEVDLSGGTSAAPSGQGVVDAGILAGNGCTVVTN